MATLSEDPVWFLYCSFEFYGKPPGETRRGRGAARRGVAAFPFTCVDDGCEGWILLFFDTKSLN